MIVEQMLMAATSEGGGAYTPNAVKFDGTNDYLTRGADLTGLSDSKSGILSFWLRVDKAPSSSSIIRSDATAGRFICVLSGSTGQLNLAGFNATGVQILRILGTVPEYVKESANWLHCLFSWDLATAATHLYVDDVDAKDLVTATNDTIDYVSATPNWAVGGSTSGTLLLGGCLSEFYFAPGQYLDFSNSTNRRKFIDASGMPVDLGSTGSTPTGTAPIIYLKGNSTGFGVNSGTGGNFTVNGTLEKASTTPATLPAFNAVQFVGTADYLARDGSAITTDGKSGIFSCWFRQDPAAGIGTNDYIFRCTDVSGYGFSARANQLLGGGLIVSVSGTDIGTTTDVLGAMSYNAVGTWPSSKWRHFLASWDTAANIGRMYLDGALVVTAAPTDTAMRYSASNQVRVCGGGAAASSFAISELYFAPNQYLDLSVQANREKFILNGAPVSLGSTGSLPTGTAPAIYLPNRSALIGTNAGTGGNFTVNGAPKEANSTPVYYYAEPIKFDGTNDYLTRGADLTGIADGKAGTVSFWLRLDGGNATIQTIIATTNVAPGWFLRRTTGNKFEVRCNNAASTIILNMLTSASYTSSPVWVHVLMSWNLATTTGQLYVNNVSDLAASPTITNDTIDYATTTPNYAVCGTVGGVNPLNGAIADLWFNTSYLDISNSANRAKFIDQTTLRPVPLGAKGELPTGSQPLLYLGRDFSNFQTNLGSGGAFTVTGALERGTTSPSDVRA